MEGGMRLEGGERKAVRGKRREEMVMVMVETYCQP